MPLNADQLLAVFPHPVLTKIIGKPNLASITLQHSKHNRNLALIRSNLGDGITGLMVLSMKPDFFKTIHPDAFKILTNLGPLPRFDFIEVRFLLCSLCWSIMLARLGSPINLVSTGCRNTARSWSELSGIALE